jgi:phosphoribosyl-ATP pyrophosphohydrolase
MKKAIFWYGTKHQLNKCKEECLELVTAIYNYNQQAPEYVLKENTKVVVDEVADVLITAIQAASIIGVDDVIERIRFKLMRLDDRIEKQMTAKNLEVQK